MNGPGWDQSKFDRTLREYLGNLESRTWPRAINKKAFFVELKALQRTPKVEPQTIDAELGKAVYTRQGGAPARIVALGYAIASKRAEKKWMRTGTYRTARKKEFAGASGSLASAWHTFVMKQFEAMTKARKRSAAFIKAGWLPGLEQLGALVGGRYSRSGTNRRGADKGGVHPAVGLNLTATIYNTAQSASAARRGKKFEVIGAPALQAAFNEEAASMEEHMRNEMQADSDKFNRAQH